MNSFQKFQWTRWEITAIYRPTKKDWDVTLMHLFFCHSCHFEPGLYVDWFLFVFASKSLWLLSIFFGLENNKFLTLGSEILFADTFLFHSNFCFGSKYCIRCSYFNYLLVPDMTVIRPRQKRFMSGNILVWPSVFVDIRPEKNIAGHKPL